MPDRVDNLHNHNTRQSANILEISSKTKFYSDYFLPSSIKLCNRLSIDTRNSRSLNIFKERIKTQNSKCPAHYYSGTRLGQLLHTRLRMNSSSLNEHLFIRNLVDSPNCACGQVESTFLSRYRILFLKAKDLHHNSKLHFICITNFISFCFVIPLFIIVFLDLSCSML